MTIRVNHHEWFVMSESAIRDVADAAYGQGFGAGRAAGRVERAS